MFRRITPPALTRSAALLALWTVVGLAFASQFYVSSVMLGRVVTWSEALGACLGDWYTWALIAIPILWFVRRYPPEAGSRWGRAFLHVGAALGFSLAYVVVRAGVGLATARLGGDSADFGDIFRPLLVRTLPFNLLIYGVIVALSHALGYYRKYHERTVQTLELEKHLAEARLQALQHQLEPHFLFNTLNGIASLMYSDVPAADRMLVRLSELLRLSMSKTGAPRTRLRDELAFIQRYLEIEQIRFRGRLTVEVDAAPDTLEAWVPTLVLQPLVENAIRHGVEPQARAGTVVVRARREGGQLELTVSDNGGGLRPAPEGGPEKPGRRKGIGLSNTRARLEQLYGARHRFDVANRPEGGCLARVTLPADGD